MKRFGRLSSPYMKHLNNKLKIFQLISSKRLASNRCFNSCIATAETVTSTFPWAFVSVHPANKVVSGGHRALIYTCSPACFSSYFQCDIPSHFILHGFYIFTQFHLYVLYLLHFLYIVILCSSTGVLRLAWRSASTYTRPVQIKNAALLRYLSSLLILY